MNLIVGPKVGGWFFPTANWWVLMLWVLPPFIALALAMILAISARVSSAAAAQQASALVTLPLIVIAYGVASNTLFKGELLAIGIGALAWLGAIFALWRASYAVSASGCWAWAPDHTRPTSGGHTHRRARELRHRLGSRGRRRARRRRDPAGRSPSNVA